MSTLSPWFPQEIIDQIVDWAALEAPESLVSLRGTSRRFVERSRRYIYRTMQFSHPRWLSGETWRILKNNPSLMGHVQQMTTNFMLPGFEVPEDDFRKALDLLDLRALDIDLAQDYREWAKFNIFERWPNLVYLSIKFFYSVAHLGVFYSLPKLRELRLLYRSSRGSFQDISQDPIMAQLPFKLKSLHYDPDMKYQGRRFPPPFLVQPGLASQIFGQLVHLSLVFELLPHHSLAFSRILPACQESGLETLQLAYGCEVRYGSFERRLFADIGAPLRLGSQFAGNHMLTSDHSETLP